MFAGKQLLLEELSSDLRRELSDLKEKGEVICVQGVIKRLLNIYVSAAEI